jgi:tRNA threonylcarbamoyladenosine biosynthesis protein TsaB
MICLGIDTSGSRVRVAVTRDHEALGARTTPDAKTHSETLLVALSESLEEAGVSLGSVELIAVGRGPGAWTGLRVGITTAKSLAYALGVPLVGVSGLDAIAAGVTGYKGKLAVIVDARRNEVCGARFTVDGRGGIEIEGGIFVAAPEDLDRFVSTDRVLVGNGVPLLAERDRSRWRALPEAFGRPDAVTVCRLGLMRYLKDGPDRIEEVVPIYVRKSDAEIGLEKKEGSS